MSGKSDGTELILEVDEQISQVHTKSLDVSFHEILSMFNDDELVIEPEFQRLFRWKEEKQSRFIESLLLELPIPPVYVIEKEGGVYELIDGLQRISSWLHFMGAHPKKVDEDGAPKRLVLDGCDIIPALNGRTYDQLPTALQIKLKRHPVRMEVIRKESDPRLRYYMFKRLNTGGELLSPQELRNCTIRLLDARFNNFIIKLSGEKNFTKCTDPLSDEKKDMMYREEYVLRFFALKNAIDKYEHRVGDFLTEYMEEVSDPEGKEDFDYENEEEVFGRTFEILAKTMGEGAFSLVSPKGNLVDGFSTYHFEAFTLGMQPLLSKISISTKQERATLRATMLEIKQDAQFKKITTGGGKNYAIPLRARVDFVRKRLKAAL